MAEKTITTGLCPGGRLRMERLLRVLEMKRVEPTLMTTHTFPFDEMDGNQMWDGNDVAKASRAKFPHMLKGCVAKMLLILLTPNSRS